MTTYNVSKLKNIIILQLIIVLYTITGIVAKIASKYKFLSYKFILFYAFEIIILGVFAMFWQQIIKKFNISVAYSNKGMAILWSLLWSAVIFNEKISINNILGALIIIIGIVVVNINE